MPKPLRSTFAHLSTLRCTRVCNLLTSALFTISSQGNSHGCWKNEISGHNRRTSLSICSRTSLSLKYVCQALSGLMLSGWSNPDSMSLSCAPGITIKSSINTEKHQITFEKWLKNKNKMSTSYFLMFTYIILVNFSFFCQKRTPCLPLKWHIVEQQFPT